MKKRKYPSWVPPEIISGYENTRELEDPSIPSRPSGLFEYTRALPHRGVSTHEMRSNPEWSKVLSTTQKKRDLASNEHFSQINTRHQEWHKLEHKIITDSRGEFIWKEVEKAEIDPSSFLQLCRLAYIGSEEDKLASRTPSKKKRHLKKIKEKAIELSCLISETEYDDLNQQIVLRCLYDHFSEESNTNNELNLLFNLYIYGPRMMSVELATLARAIEYEETHGRKLNMECDEEKESRVENGSIPTRPYKQKQMTENGHRFFFIKSLAFLLKDYSGDPQSELVANTTNLFFDEPRFQEISSTYVNQNWQSF